MSLLHGTFSDSVIFSQSLGTLLLTLQLTGSCSSHDLAQRAEEISPLAFHGCYTGLNFSTVCVLNDQPGQICSLGTHSASRIAV